MVRFAWAFTDAEPVIVEELILVTREKLVTRASVLRKWSLRPNSCGFLEVRDSARTTAA